MPCMATHRIVVAEKEAGLIGFEWLIAMEHNLRGKRLEDGLIHWHLALDLQHVAGSDEIDHENNSM